MTNAELIERLAFCVYGVSVTNSMLATGVAQQIEPGILSDDLTVRLAQGLKALQEVHLYMGQVAGELREEAQRLASSE